jgi:hypothetical protein
MEGCHLVKVIITIVISLLVLLVLFGVVVPMMVAKNSRQPGFDRKWTDPKHHDKLR